MTDSRFLIRRTLQLSLEGDRLLKESLVVGEELKNKLIIKANGFQNRAKSLYYQAQEV